MILVNVLLFVAIAAAIVALMLSAQGVAGERTIMLGEAARAGAIARGGELSAVAALRRDALEAPASDHAGEAWGRVAQDEVPIVGGSFDLAIADAQGRFNINSLAGDDPVAIEALGRIAAALRLPPEVSLRVAVLIRTGGPIDDLSPLRSAGLDAATTARLERLVTALPGTARVNLNAASEELLAILLDSPAKARMLVAVRERRGFLTPEDFDGGLPPGSGFTSDLYWVRTRVTIGDTRQQLTSLIARRREGARLVVAPVARWRGAQAPAL